jgi:hypothetical protein
MLKADQLLLDQSREEKRMGKITIDLPEELEHEVRMFLVEKYDGKIHGRFREFVVEALTEHLEHLKQHSAKGGASSR